jgi:hypothetical protein
VAPELAPTPPADPDLLLIMEHWHDLPEPIRAAIRALIQTSR